MNSLFSTFDPQSWMTLPLAWVSCLLVLVLLPSPFWLAASPLSLVSKSLAKNIKEEFETIFGRLAAPGLTLLSLSLLLVIATNNFLGLLPYVFTASSHLTLTLSLALPLWLGHILMAWLKTPQSMLAHLVPLGTPPALMPFMVIIELVSALIRPVTLSVRLAANMMAGHLLLTLLTQGAPFAPYPVVGVIVVSVILLATLESAVALIQAYVFSILSTLYLEEVNSPALSV